VRSDGGRHLQPQVLCFRAALSARIDSNQRCLGTLNRAGATLGAGNCSPTIRDGTRDPHAVMRFLLPHVERPLGALGYWNAAPDVSCEGMGRVPIGADRDPNPEANLQNSSIP
jgi:hypothetical protein